MPANRRRREFRGALLLPLAAWALHQLRYDLWFGAGAHRALVARGHGYMAGIEPLLVGLAAAVGGVVVARLARAWTTGAPSARPRASFASVALTAALVLLAVFVLQETLEGVVALGHPAPLADGGWIAVPLALLLGAVVALVVRGGEMAVRIAARAGGRHARPARRPATLAPRRPRPRAVRTRSSVLAGAAAGRAPPRAARLAPIG